MRLRILHRTQYEYASTVTASINEVRLTPATSQWQQCEASFISVLPATRLTHYEDLNKNCVHRFEIPSPHQSLVIESRAVVTTRSKVDYRNLPYGFRHADLPRCQRINACYPFLQDSTHITRTPEIWRQALDIQGDSEDVFQTAYAIMEHIFRNYTYRAGATTVSTHASEVIRNRTGVCQDFSHAMVSLCRAIGIPARYVSGYFYDGSRGHHLRGSEASHAWAEIFIDGTGWVGLDPTNNKVVDDTYIVLATGRDYSDVTPVIGSYYGSGKSRMDVTVRVERLALPAAACEVSEPSTV